MQKPTKPDVYIWRFQIFGPHNLVTLGSFFAPPKKRGLCVSSTGFFLISFFRRQDPEFRPWIKRWSERGKAPAHLNRCQLLAYGGRHFPSIPSSDAPCNY